MKGGKADMKRKRSIAREESAAGWLKAAAVTPGPRMRPGRLEAIFNRVCERLEKEGAGSRREARIALAARRGRARRAVLVPAVSLALLLLSAGGAFAMSYDAAPGSSLYGTKLFFERARLTLTPGNDGKVGYRMRLTEKRMAELEKMLAAGAESGGSSWESAYRREIEGLQSQISVLPDGERERRQEEAAIRLQEQYQRMEELKHSSTAALAPHIDNAGEDCARAAQCMRGQCGRDDGGGGEGRDAGNGSPEAGGGKGEDGQGNYGNGNGKHGPGPDGGRDE
jgi:hypothetical protein